MLRELRIAEHRARSRACFLHAVSALMSNKRELRLKRAGLVGLIAAAASVFTALFASPVCATPMPSALRFEPNVGQFDPSARYVARGRHYALFLTSTGATLALHRDTSAPPGTNADVQSVLTMRVKGARSVEPTGVSALSGRSNYFVGKDRAAWRTGVETYARVRYENVLPGVDVEYHGTDGRELEYDFRLAPGVLPSSVELELEGVSRVELTADGRALLHLQDGAVLTKLPPVAYQTRRGQRVAVRTRFELREGRLGFALGQYDATLPLVIDPVLFYSTYFGGSSFDEAYAIAADAAGNTYIAGYTASTLFPTFSPEQPKHGGGAYDAFVVKLNPSGSNIIYSTYLGGSGADIAYAVATDALGNAYVTGLTNSPNFPLSSALQSALGGGQDAFVSKLDATGTLLTYSTYLGGSGDDYARGIAVSNLGNAYLVGITFSPNFPKVAALQATLKGSQDAFVSELAPSGASLVYSTFLGGDATEYGNAIALDSAGAAYLVGSTTSSNFPTVNARQPSHGGGGTDAFVSKLNPGGSALAFSTYLGGSASDEALGVCLALGSPVVVGDTLSGNFPLSNAAQPTLGAVNHTDAFVTRFDGSGTVLTYSTYFGGTGNDSATAVACDAFGDAYAVGLTNSVDLPVQAPLDGQSSYHGAGDAFLLALQPSGSRFVYASYLGGAAEDHATGVTVGVGTTFIVGNTSSTDFPKITPIINGLVGAQDAFIVKLPAIQGAAAAPALGWLASLVLAGCFLVTVLVLLAGRRRARRAGVH